MKLNRPFPIREGIFARLQIPQANRQIVISLKPPLLLDKTCLQFSKGILRFPVLRSSCTRVRTV